MGSFLASFVSRFKRSGRYVKAHLNFYRIHILFFIFTPLIFSAILYGSDGHVHISYIDALFNSVSAVTVCGLTTVDLSGLTNFQQAVLFFLMCIGNPVIISWVMVYVRREFFKIKFRVMIQAELSRRVSSKVDAPVHIVLQPWWKRLLRIAEGDPSGLPRQESKENGDAHPKLRTDMIRRMDEAPKLVNPSGWISEGRPDPPPPSTALQSPASPQPRSPLHQVALTGSGTSIPSVSDATDLVLDQELREAEAQRRGETDKEVFQGGEDEAHSTQMQRHPTLNVTSARFRHEAFPRTQTVEFAPTPPGKRSSIDDPSRRERRYSNTPSVGIRAMARPTMSITYTSQPYPPHPPVRTKDTDFGGFPMPHKIIGRIFRRFFPKLERKLTRTITMPRTQTLASQYGSAVPGSRAVSYISFDAVVGRNSKFERLTREQLDELGGVEYRALTALLWIVGGYHIVLQVVAFIVIAPYMSMERWQDDFKPPAEHRDISSVWYSAFQVVSSYTNTGMSLVDESMLPFQKAYPMIVFMVILILAGNTAFPVCLRLVIWVISKIVPKRSRSYETLTFLLDHPRRCFVYLFPSHQTWFLFTVLVALNGTDWFFFMVLDISNPALDSIPLGDRFLLGLLQASAVRAAGFGSVPLNALAPGVKVLYVLMMYVSVYPVAMSVRSTNVYEERSLGVFRDGEESLHEEDINLTGNRATVWSRYLAMHARKQLSFDMWWLGLALFLVCTIERDGLENPDNLAWFNIFSIIFELVSAYGSVGLSLGTPLANYSFSGALRPLSKLIICAVMLRGRHRGLPVAIDRAVMLPFEFDSNQETPGDETPEEERDEQGEEEELQEVAPIDPHPFPGSVAGQEKVGEGTVGNAFAAIVDGDAEKVKGDQNHERTSKVAPDLPVRDGEEFELSQRHGLGET